MNKRKIAGLGLAVLVFGTAAVLAWRTGMSAINGPADAQTKTASDTGPSGVTAAGPALQLTQQWQSAGVKACLQIATALGRSTMQGVTEYATTSSWNSGQPDSRFAMAAMGQKFGQSASAPLGVSSVFAAPASDGKCDGAAIQILPTTSACAAIQSQIAIKGKLLSILAGIPLLQDERNAHVMLIPSAGSGCVIVGMSSVYGG